MGEGGFGWVGGWVGGWVMNVPSLNFKYHCFSFWGVNHVHVNIILAHLYVFLSPFHLFYVAVSRPCHVSELHPDRASSIDLFAHTAAILILLDLRSIMGCPGGTHSVFTCAFRAKRELHRIFLGKKAITTTSKHGTVIFYFHYNFFSENLKKNWPEKCT